MKKSYSIFYSWQSDLKFKNNKNLILNSLRKSKKKLEKDGKRIELEINLDRDTKNESGSPSIPEIIFKKISNSDIFICDITIINNSFLNRKLKKRLSPNPNVLIELGYAINLLGWERIICINNLKYNKLEDLPFDIRNHRITTYHSDKNNKNFLNSINFAVNSIINDYDKIIERHNYIRFRKHDYRIHKKLIQICTEEKLYDTLILAVDSNATRASYFKIWNEIRQFYKYSYNHFIDKEIEKKLKIFILKITEFNNICTENFFPNYKDESDFNNTDILYFIKKETYINESIFEAEKRRKIVTDELYVKKKEIKDCYKDYILSLKKKGIL